MHSWPHICKIITGGFLSNFRLQQISCLAAAADKLRSNSDSECSQLWSPIIAGKATDWLLRPVSHALEEAKEKGSLIDRVAALEEKFLLISIELKKLLSLGHTSDTTPLSKSPSSRSEDSYKTVPDLSVLEEKHEISLNQGQHSPLSRQNALARDKANALLQGRPTALKLKEGTKTRNERDPESNSEVSFDEGDNLTPTSLGLLKKKRKKQFRQFLYKLLHPGSQSHAQDTQREAL
ncbi:hypothetical protein O6H91_21G015600 [Diphasiastrum complanatum]|uniref:Uncharacterized protein n=1 Tax=Diphasiastrum complanatum TaxID=34168 RepID=A0ACC2AIJ0_DIPCM|nr:hypothetical protein O6H91_21G015600 [Diphasiastrum complanatum]